MNVEGKTVLVTGANRGIGKALVDEALRRGAARVYAGHRSGLTHADERVVAVTLDVGNGEQVRAAAEQIPTLDILINNAGIADYDDLSDPSVLQKMLAVNLYGTLEVINAFLPALSAGGGAIVNNTSVNAFAPLPLIASYSVSKAAVFNLTQSLRSILADRGITVHAMMTGLVDTDMNAGFDVPKATTEVAARGTFDGIEKGEEEIFPDPMAQQLADSWRTGAGKGLERQYAQVYQQFSHQS